MLGGAEHALQTRAHALPPFSRCTAASSDIRWEVLRVLGMLRGLMRMCMLWGSQYQVLCTVDSTDLQRGRMDILIEPRTKR